MGKKEKVDDIFRWLVKRMKMMRKRKRMRRRGKRSVVVWLQPVELVSSLPYTMVQNSKKLRMISHPIIHCPTSEGVSEQVSAVECSGASKASSAEQANE